ncbi:hypothetical protein HDU76_003692 [Blyttiomyces sp. JEL0837]|nr:hypothetical protein HDU76_003692 [Blyttiomyces sp. JEL0837]
MPFSAVEYSPTVSMEQDVNIKSGWNSTGVVPAGVGTVAASSRVTFKPDLGIPSLSTHHSKDNLPPSRAKHVIVPERLIAKRKAANAAAANGNNGAPSSSTTITGTNSGVSNPTTAVADATPLKLDGRRRSNQEKSRPISWSNGAGPATEIDDSIVNSLPNRRATVQTTTVQNVPETPFLWGVKPKTTSTSSTRSAGSNSSRVANKAGSGSTTGKSLESGENLGSGKSDPGNSVNSLNTTSRLLPSAMKRSPNTSPYGTGPRRGSTQQQTSDYGSPPSSIGTPSFSSASSHNSFNNATKSVPRRPSFGQLQPPNFNTTNNTQGLSPQSTTSPISQSGSVVGSAGASSSATHLHRGIITDNSFGSGDSVYLHGSQESGNNGTSPTSGFSMKQNGFAPPSTLFMEYLAQVLADSNDKLSNVGISSGDEPLGDDTGNREGCAFSIDVDVGYDRERASSNGSGSGSGQDIYVDSDGYSVTDLEGSCGSGYGSGIDSDREGRPKPLGVKRLLSNQKQPVTKDSNTIVMAKTGVENSNLLGVSKGFNGREGLIMENVSSLPDDMEERVRKTLALAAASQNKLLNVALANSRLPSPYHSNMAMAKPAVDENGNISNSGLMENIADYLDKPNYKSSVTDLQVPKGGDLQVPKGGDNVKKPQRDRRKSAPTRPLTPIEGQCGSESSGSRRGSKVWKAFVNIFRIR